HHRGIVRLLFREPEFILVLRYDFDDTAHGVVTTAAHLVAGDLIFEVGVTQLFLHVFGSELGREPHRGRRTRHGIHLLTEVDQADVMDHVAGIDDKLDGFIYHAIHLVAYDDIVMRSGVIPDEAQLIIILVADILIVFLAEDAVLTRVADDPAELLAGDLHLQRILWSVAGDAEPVEKAETYEHREGNGRHYRPDDFQAVVMGEI